jgi:hypothetical protein
MLIPRFWYFALIPCFINQTALANYDSLQKFVEVFKRRLHEYLEAIPVFCLGGSDLADQFDAFFAEGESCDADEGSLLFEIKTSARYLQTQVKQI